MKRKIRRGMFESNSSSSHSLTIDTFNGKYPETYKGEVITLYGDEYGWGYDELTAPLEIASYIATEAHITKNEALKEKLIYVLKDTLGCSDVKFELQDGYIDHQSIGLICHEEKCTVHGLTELIFGGTIIIDNDNDH